MIKTIIFDLGNVIVPFDIEIGLGNLAKACDFSSIEIREKLVGEKHSELFHTGEISADELFKRIKNSLNLQMNFEEFVDVWNSIFWFEPIVSEKLIEKLSREYRLLTLSDTNELHFNFIKPKFPLLRFFDDFVLSHEVGAIKPSPKIYEAAIEKANCLPEECFFTDDKIENIEGAKKFGIKAVQFISTGQLEKDLKKFDLLSS